MAGILFEAPCRNGWRPCADTARNFRWSWVAGHGIPVTDQAHFLQGFLGRLAGRLRVRLTEIHEDEMVVSPVRHEGQSVFLKAVSERLRILDDLRGVLFEFGLECFVEADGFPRDVVQKWPALHPRHDRLIDS